MENLQRKDVHPMDEAAGFKAYQAKKKCDVKELAAVFAKTERYIVSRLALNELIQEVQKDFLKDMLTVGQAEIFAKLPAKEQKQFKQDTYSSYNKKYQYTAAEMKEKVQKNILLKLDAAPWKRDDETLVPAAGSCNNCKKRTSCNALLFADMVKDDRCLDGACYKNKGEAFFAKEVELIATTKPEIKFYTGYDKSIDKAVKKIAGQYNIPLLSFGDNGVSSYSYDGGKPTKCFAVAGYDKGKYVTIYIKGSSKASAKAAKGDTDPVAIKEQVTDIKNRLVRSKELDAEKVWLQVRSLANDETLITGDTLSKIDMVAVSVAMYEKISYVGRREFEKICGKNNAMALSKSEIDSAVFNKLLRLFFTDVLNIMAGSHLSGGSQNALKQVVEQYKLNEVHAIELAQQNIAAKREANAQKKITALQTTAAPAKAAKPKADIPASKKAKPVKKKAVKPATKKAAAPVKKKAGKKPIVKTKKKAA